MDKVTFKASFPPIGSAIKITGNGDGMRIQLDIPESEMDKAAWLLAMRESVLNVTIEIENDRPTKREVTAPKRTAAKKRK